MTQPSEQPKPQISPDGYSYWDGSDWKQMPGKVCEWDGFEWKVKPSSVESEWNGTVWVSKPPGVEARWSGMQWIAKPQGVDAHWNGSEWLVKPAELSEWSGTAYVVAPAGVESRWDGSKWVVKPEGRNYWDVRSKRWRPDRRRAYAVIAIVAILVAGLAAGGLIWKSDADEKASEQATASAAAAQEEWWTGAKRSTLDAVTTGLNRVDADCAQKASKFSTESEEILKESLSCMTDHWSEALPAGAKDRVNFEFRNQANIVEALDNGSSLTFVDDPTFWVTGPDGVRYVYYRTCVNASSGQKYAYYDYDKGSCKKPGILSATP